MRKILNYIIVFLFLAVPLFAQERRIPQAPDVKEQELQFFFDGAWLPDMDPAEIGAKNYSELKNLRYGPEDLGLEGVQGYSKINTTTALSTYTSLRSGFQLKTDRTTASYVLVQAENSAEDASRIYVNTTAIPDQGDFSSSVELDTSGNEYVADSTGAGLGRFSAAPNGNVTYANGVESLIWAGEEMRVGGFLTFTTATEVLDETDFGTNAEWDVTGDVLDGSSDPASGGEYVKFLYDGDLDGTLTQVNADQASNAEASTWYYLSFTVAVTTAPDGDFTLVVTEDKIADTEVTLFDVAAGKGVTAGRHTFTFLSDSGAATDDFVITAAETTATQGNFTIDDITLQKVLDNPADVTEAVNNTLSSTGNTVTLAPATRGSWVVLTTRKIQGVYYDVSSANGSASLLTCEYWQSDGAWVAVTSPVDGTSASSKSLAQDGWFMFDYTSDAAPYYIEGRYLYAYKFHLSAGSAVLKYAAVNAPMQDISDIWDGVPRQPISFQVWTGSNWVDYTLEVNTASYGDQATPYIAILDSLQATGTDYIIVMSDDRLAGMNFNFLAGKTNESAAIANVLYWNGSAYTAVPGTEIDGTFDENDSFSENGTLWWQPPAESSEVKKEEFGVFGYSYKIDFTGPLDAEVDLDVVTLLPAQKTIRPFKFVTQYKNRVFLCGYTQGKEGNRCDYSATNTTEVWNGADSSDGGLYSLYFGGAEDLTAGTQIYNRYGSQVITMMTAFKSGETYVLRGDNPEDYVISRVSSNIGCPAPLTLASAEVAFEIAKDVRRNMLFWLSDVGPYSFDGQVLSPIKGVDKYFDPDDDDCINFDEIERSRGWYDTSKKEYNLLIPSGTSQTTNNVWLVYDIIKKKWFRKDTGAASFPQVGFMVQDAYGVKYPYGGIDTGRMMRLENGDDWDGTPIEQIVETGDFWPTGNIWDLTRIRQIKVMAKRIPEEHKLIVEHASDTDESLGLSGIWVDDTGNWENWEGGEWVSASLASINLYLDDSLNRIARDTIADNLYGWSHRFGFIISTDETTKGLQPLGWGIVFYKEDRRDD